LDATTAARIYTMTPVLGVKKKDSGKIRLITDLRGFDATHQVPHFRCDTWATIQEVLRGPSPLDLESLFHHLGMHKKLARWMRFKEDGDISRSLACLPNLLISGLEPLVNPGLGHYSDGFFSTFSSSSKLPTRQTKAQQQQTSQTRPVPSSNKKGLFLHNPPK